MATQPHTTTVNRSEILRAAWASYREQDNFVARTSGMMSVDELVDTLVEGIRDGGHRKLVDVIRDEVPEPRDE